jgi:hypothetical protein
MGTKAKKLCKWKSEDITKKLGKFSDIVRNPQYVCTKCGRVADQKKWLHDLRKISIQLTNNN